VDFCYDTGQATRVKTETEAVSRIRGKPTHGKSKLELVLGYGKIWGKETPN